MDRIKYLKEKLGFNALFPSQIKPMRSGLCCISIYPNGFSLIHTTLNETDNKLQLSLREFFPCTQAKLAERLAEEITNRDLSGTECSWILTPENYQMLLLEKLPVPAAEFQAAIRWKVKDLLSFPVEDAVIDSFDVPSSTISSAKKNIMVVVSQLSYLQPLSDIISESGLNLTTIDINDFALRNIACLYEQEDNSVALIYLQEKSSKIIVVRQKTFYFARRFEWGLNLVSDPNLEASAMDRNIDKLSLEVQRSFDYYQSQWRLPAPTKIILAPELMPGIDIRSYLIKRLTTLVVDLDLNQLIDCKPILDPIQQGQFLPLIGGALRKEITANATAD